MFPLDIPEVQELTEKLFVRIPNESGRGALLIATSYVDDF